jgi:hypothetical protein
MTKQGVIIENLIHTQELTCCVLEVGSQKFVSAFAIKENRLIPKETIHLEFRSSLMALVEVLLIPLALQIDNNPELTYCAWLNYHESEEVKKWFRLFAAQEEIRLLLVNENDQVVKIIRANNNLRIGFIDHLQRLKNRIPWSKVDFEYAKSKVLQLYPDPVSLWYGLKFEKTRCNL